jgi:23S rRNA (pseudouridine1915-N3)-methyltransferase
VRFRVVAVGARQPDWVQQGFEEYRRRLPGFELVEIAPVRRGRGRPVEGACEEEGRRLLQRVPEAHHLVALEVRGQEYDTEGLAHRLQGWLELGQPVDFALGGADGLSPACLERAGERWSLSRLTLAHGLARVVLAEALYRAYSLLRGHPYHRA